MSEINRFLANKIVITGKTVLPATSVRKNAEPDKTYGFGEILNEQLHKSGELKFSKHAETRLKSRNIQLNATQIQKISNAVIKAEQKGVRESLILMGNLALVVSVKNKTVITTVNNDELKDNVFTNIDGAVIV
ncbi:MAG: hypothetical protein PWP27_97 [Clostridiales bacterium]|nr:hypothetical protein [Clostridiales bacterium]